MCSIFLGPDHSLAAEFWISWGLPTNLTRKRKKERHYSLADKPASGLQSDNQSLCTAVTLSCV